MWRTKLPALLPPPALPAMSDAEWHELEDQGEHARPDLLERTVQEDEHPEGMRAPASAVGA